MATLVHQCPHCLAEKMSLTVRAQSSWKNDGVYLNFLHLSCPVCGHPSAAEILSRTGQQLADMGMYPYGLTHAGFYVSKVWPEPLKPSVPDHVPEPVAKAFLAAERNFPIVGMEEAAAGSYGRALDVGTKIYAPDLAGELLYNRIRKLAEQHRITADLAKWSHAIRLIRNDALHDIESVTRDELVAIRGFAETVLTYLFTLPGMLKARQAVTDEKPQQV